MECARKTWISLMCCANELLKNETPFFNGMENSCTDMRTFSNENQKIVDLHVQILEMKKRLDALDDHLWKHLTIGSAPNTVRQDPVLHAPLMQIAENASAESVHNSEVPTDNEVVTQNCTYQNFNLAVFDENVCEQLKQRYEGFPYPPNSVIYAAEDEKMDTAIFLARFPVEGHENPRFQNVNKERDYHCDTTLKCKMDITKDTFAEPLRPGKLTKVRRRQPREVRLHPFENADAHQKIILSKPLASPPRKRPSSQGEKEQNIVKLSPKKKRTPKVKHLHKESPIIKKAKLEENPKKRYLNCPTVLTRSHTPATKKKDKKDNQNKTRSKSNGPMQSDFKKAMKLTSHFVAKKAYKSVHSKKK